MPVGPSRPPPSRLSEIEAGIEETGQALAGRRCVLRLLADPVEIERAEKLEVLEGKANVPNPHPRPRESERCDQEQGVDSPESKERGPRHRRAETGSPEARVMPEEPPREREEPDPVESHGRQREQDREKEGAEEVAPPRVEGEPLVDEVRVGDHERLALGDEERVVEPEGETGQERPLDEDLDEL